MIQATNQNVALRRTNFPAQRNRTLIYGNLVLHHPWWERLSLSWLLGQNCKITSNFLISSDYFSFYCGFHCLPEFLHLWGILGFTKPKFFSSTQTWVTSPLIHHTSIEYEPTWMLELIGNFTRKISGLHGKMRTKLLMISVTFTYTMVVWKTNQLRVILVPKWLEHQLKFL